MSNWDFVFPYSKEACEWLDSLSLPHPEVRAGNRLPSTAEVKHALRAIGAEASPPQLLVDDFNWDDGASIPSEAFKMKGDLLLEFRLLSELCKSCGQLWYYPDTGECAVIFDTTMNSQELHEVYLAAGQASDSWEVFHQKAYGDTA